MMFKEYKLYPTKAKTVRENNLTSSAHTRYGSEDVYYDFSLFDEIKFDHDYEREMLENDIMTHHAVAWYEQPLPTLIMWNDFISYHGQVKVNVDRVFKANGKRMMVIVEVCKAHITRDVRHSVYDRYYETEREYEADNHHNQRPMDLEVA